MVYFAEHQRRTSSKAAVPNARFNFREKTAAIPHLPDFLRWSACFGLCLTCVYADSEDTSVAPHTEAAHVRAQETPAESETDASDSTPFEKAKSLRVKSLLRWAKHLPSFWKPRYYFVAQNAHECEFLYGLIVDNPIIGRASVDFMSPGRCNCHGVAQVTHIPHGGGTFGQEGYIKVKCSDGRKMKGRFRTLTLTTGTATVSDNLGKTYEGTFGHTVEQAIAAQARNEKFITEYGGSA